MELDLQGSACFKPSSGVVLVSVRVVDCAVMDEESKPPKPQAWSPQWGTWPQWIAAMAALAVCTITAVNFVDSHIDKLFAPVDKKFTDIGTKIDTVDKKFDPVNQKLMEQEGKLGIVQGQVNTLLSGHIRLTREQNRLKDQMEQQQALNRLQDPNRVLATIKAELQIAEAEKRKIPQSDLADYKNAVYALSSSTREYWTTVAAIINYQSLLNQMSGEAPDPAKVAKPCFDERSSQNLFTNWRFHNCIVVLDTEAFEHVTFRDSVVIYHGGPVTLTDAIFVNCLFRLELPQEHSVPTDTNLILAILNSPDQKNVHVTR